MPVRVLIADDQVLVRAGFKLILDAEEEIDIIGEASDGLEAVTAALTLKPEVVLMDIRMPGIDGLEATRRILAENPDPPIRILVLTTFDINEYVYDALRAGASGFLLKDVPPEQLVAGVHVVARGEALLAPTITRRLIEDHPEAAADERLVVGEYDADAHARSSIGRVANTPKPPSCLGPARRSPP